MKTENLVLFLVTFLFPSICSAGEPNKGTVIMISGVSGWLLLSSAFIFFKEIKRNRNNDNDQ